MTRTQRRRAHRERQAELMASGHYAPRPRRSHYQRPDIADAMRGDMRTAASRIYKKPHHPLTLWNADDAKRPSVALLKP